MLIYSDFRRHFTKHSHKNLLLSCLIYQLMVFHFPVTALKIFSQCNIITQIKKKPRLGEELYKTIRKGLSRQTVEKQNGFLTTSFFRSCVRSDRQWFCCTFLVPQGQVFLIGLWAIDSCTFALWVLLKFERSDELFEATCSLSTPI